jgi:hypothetical protein
MSAQLDRTEVEWGWAVTWLAGQNPGPWAYGPAGHESQAKHRQECQRIAYLRHRIERRGLTAAHAEHFYGTRADMLRWAETMLARNGGAA